MRTHACVANGLDRRRVRVVRRCRRAGSRRDGSDLHARPLRRLRRRSREPDRDRSDCRTRVVSTIEIEGGVFDVAWPRRDQPLAVATAEAGALDATHVLVIEQPLADAAKRPPPRTIVPPGKGDMEPEG